MLASMAIKRVLGGESVVTKITIIGLDANMLGHDMTLCRRAPGRVVGTFFALKDGRGIVGLHPFNQTGCKGGFHV